MAVTQQQLGERIRVARERFHLTPEELGEFVGLSAEAIGEIERGERSLGCRRMDDFAYALGRNAWEFHEPDFVDGGALAAHFWAEKPPGTERKQLITALREGMAYALQFSSLEGMLGIDRARVLPKAVDLPTPRCAEEATEQGERVASVERQRLRLSTMSIERPQHLLETQGVGSMAAPLPPEISGVMLFDPRIGAFVLFNAEQPLTRRRFSLAHEYAHVLMDRHRPSCFSRRDEGDDLIEVRANAFAAEFLMPRSGVIRLLESNAAVGGKVPLVFGAASVAQEYGVSRRSALVRLKQIGRLSDSDCKQIEAEEAAGLGRQSTTLLSLFNPPEADSCRESRGRLLGLACECYRMDEISRGKLNEIGHKLGFDRERITSIVQTLGME